jgi:hypothetical protein
MLIFAQDYVNQLAKHQNAVVLLIEYREIHMFGPTTVTDKGRTVTPLVLDDFQVHKELKKILNI